MTTSPLAPRTPTVAARATELSELQGEGDTQAAALDRVSVGFGQSHAERAARMNMLTAIKASGEDRR